MSDELKIALVETIIERYTTMRKAYVSTSDHVLQSPKVQTLFNRIFALSPAAEAVREACAKVAEDHMPMIQCMSVEPIVSVIERIAASPAPFDAADRIAALEAENKRAFDLLTKAVGDISALAIMAGMESKITHYTSAYTSAINAHDTALSEGGGDA